MRRLIPYTVLPLALIACALACSPWLRAYPSDVLAVPLFGAALLGVLVPLIVVGVGMRRLWATALIDVVLFVFYELLVTLRAPVGFDQLWNGLVHGPSQILTFALPLVSPRTLLVAPVALTWLAGAIVGECVARAWQSVVPYAVLLVTFGLAYAGTARAITSSSAGRRYDTLLAGGLLLTLLLLRAAQAWVGQERGAETTQVDSRLPVRGLVVGGVVSVVIALAAAGAVQSNAFTGQPTTPARIPPLNRSVPLTPVSFVNSLRPVNPKDQGQDLFTVTVNRRTSNYISLATVDTYDGSGWTFERTFRPSGGVIPAEDDPTLRAKGPSVTQQYTIDAGPLTTVPWMPYLNRASRVSGVTVNIDAGSGMIVPAHRLTGSTTYSVTSRTTQTQFSDLPATALPSLSGGASDIQLPGVVSNQLTTLIKTLEQETGVSSSQTVAFLQAVARQFQTTYALSGAPDAPGTSATPRRFAEPAAVASKTHAKTSGKTSGGASAKKTPAKKTTPAAKPSATPSAGASSSPSNKTSSGGTGFADVLASIRQNRSATPEQYATLTALIARKLNIRARLVSGFRVTPPSGSDSLPQGRYVVTGSEAWTWVEVPVTNVGWVVLDPSPGTYANSKNSSANAVPTRSSSPTPTQSVQISKANNSQGNDGHAVAPSSTVPHSHGMDGWTVVWIVLGAVVVALVLLLALLLLRKRLRARSRRASGDPRRRLIGAWQETLDVLMESGLPELESYTSTEVATATHARFGGEPAAQARYVGDAANAAIFGPATWVGPAEADEAWRAQRVLRKSVRRTLSLGSRMSASLRYHRPPRRGPLVGPASWLVEARTKAGLGERTSRRRGGHRRSRPKRAR